MPSPLANAHLKSKIEPRQGIGRVMLAKVENKDTQSVITALIKQARKLPKELYRSLAWDRGHRKFTIATKIDVYFCDPKSPWQRGRNENTNRFLRQYLPKGIDL
jgi:IS30 family transposase